MQDWRELAHGRPGSRFTDFYERRHDDHAGRLSATLSTLGGILLVALGLVLGLTPGPGFLFVLAGLAVLAARSRALARSLDRFELRLRASFRRLRKR